MLKENTLAPDFELKDSNNQTHRLSDLAGKLTLVYFYPRDNTPGCTQQACDFRDNLALLNQANCQLFGISKDSIKSHENFTNKYDLNFPLLSDPQLTAHKAYQVLNDDLKTIRSTFLINKTGRIIKIWSKVKVKDHIQDVIHTIRDL